MRIKSELVYLAMIAAGFAGVASGLLTTDSDDSGSPYERRGPGNAFFNWENPQVHPAELTPDGTRLLVTNTADNRLEVFDVTAGVPVSIGAISVGLDPVAVRARTANEAWVVNHISDSVSVVDLTTMNVVRTIKTLDEPCDVVFAGNPARAFVSCSQVNTIQVFDAASPGAPVASIVVDAEEPRALAVSPDGSTVYAAIFESGNRSTILGGGASGMGTVGFPPNIVGDPVGPYAGQNPPPNDGIAFDPPLAPGLPAAPRVGLIVKQNDTAQWMDDNAHDWTDFVSGARAGRSGRVVGWQLLDHDVAIINASSLGVTYADTLMNLCMGMSVNPDTGRVCVVGTDATNEVRFEPNVKGRFIHVKVATVNPTNVADKTITDLNPHITYAVPTVPQQDRDRSIGDPRAVAWNNAGTRAYVAGMGSNNLVVIDAAGARAGLADTIPVGEGPTGIALDEPRGVMYVLNRFDASISVVSLTSETETARVPFFDPTPSAIKVGRKHLYDTHKNSGLGQIACASCHIDGRMDKLAWDLGDPTGVVEQLTGLNLGFGFPGLEPNTTQPPYAPFHPMKGPMTTQTLQDIVGKEPHHWRGDRSGIEAFAPAFQGLQGDDVTLTATEMQEFENFLATVRFPPNPFRNLDNTLPTNLPLTGHYKTGRFGGAGTPLPNGNAVTGLALYRSTTRLLDGGALSCVNCHTLPTGAGPDHTLVGLTYQPLAPGADGQRHIALVSVDGSTNVAIKIPQVRNAYEKGGFNTTRLTNTAGFGFLHDGSVDSLERFISEPAFNVNNDQEVADLTAFVLAISGSELPMGTPTNLREPPGPSSLDTHAAVGAQVTLAGPPDAAQTTTLNTLYTLANANKIGLIAKGRVGGLARGWSYTGANTFQSDRAGETATRASLEALAAPGAEITWTAVPEGSETRIGIDRDIDGCLDRDFADGICGQTCNPDYNMDGGADITDVLDLANDIASGQQSYPPNSPDFNGDGGADTTDILDLANVVAGAPCP